MKKLLVSLLALVMVLMTISPSIAKADYDEDVIRAFKKLKIQRVKTNIKLPEYASKEEIQKEVQTVLLKKKYFRKKLKNKPAVVLVQPKTDGEMLKIKALYVYKNPEIYLYSYDKNIPKDVLRDRKQVSKKIEDNVTLYAISSNKIAKQNQWKIKKLGKKICNFPLVTFTTIPKFGLGYVLNPPFEWLKTGTKADINKHIIKEVELLMTEEKEYGQVLYIDKKPIIIEKKTEPIVKQKDEIKLEPVKTQVPKEEVLTDEITEEELLKKLESIEPKEEVQEPKVQEEPVKLETKAEPKVEKPLDEAKIIKETPKKEPKAEIKEEPKAEPKAKEETKAGEVKTNTQEKVDTNIEE